MCPKYKKCLHTLLFVNKATTIFQMFSLSYYTFIPLALPQDMTQGQL